MLKVRNLTESLEKKYNNLVDESYEYEMEDELDYIMDDDSLSDEEKEQSINDLYNKYNIDEGWSDEDIASIPFSELISGNWFGAKESDYGGTVDKSFFSKWGDTEDTKFSDEDPESLNESCDGWIAFYNGKKLEIPKSDVDGGIYAAKQKAIKELKVPKSKIGLLGIKPAYNESLTESVAGDIIWEKVRDYIQELIETEVVDNLVSVVSSEIPEYNPDWCGDSSFTSQCAVEKLAEELATELMFNLE